MRVGKFRLSPSSLSRLEKDETCPYKWNKQWVEKEFRTPPTEPMLLGLYFESVVLGMTAGKDKNEVEELEKKLPRTKAGALTAGAKRVVEQAQRVKDMVWNKENPNFIGLIPYEVQLTVEDDDTKVILDWTTKQHDIVDLKLTGDLSNDYGPYSWANPAGMDLMQQVICQHLYESEYGTKVASNNILIADYSTNLRVKHVKLNVLDTTTEEVLERFRAGREVVEHYNKNGYPFLPSESECESCPLECAHRFKLPEVEVEVIEY